MGGSFAFWTAREREQLAVLLGDQPFDVAVNCYRQWASTHHLPERSPKALKAQALKLGRSMRPTGQWLSSAAIGAMIGKDRSTVKCWASNGWVRRHGRVLCRADVKQLARDRPWIFGGCDRSGLMQLLEDERLVDSILEAYPHKYGRPIRVIHLTTGRRYESAHAAARACFIDRTTVITAMATGRETVGGRFAAA